MTVTVHARQSASEHPTESPKSRDPSPHAPHLPKQRTGSADFGKSHPHPKDTSTTYPTLQRPVIDNQTPSDKQHYGRKSDERYPMSSSNNKNWREVSPTSSRSPRSPKSSEGPYRNTRHSNYHHSLSHNDESSKPLDGGSARESTGEEEYKDELVSEDDGREDCDAGRYDDNDGGDEDKLNEDENDNDEEDDGEEEDEEDEEEGTEATDHTPKSDDESSGLVFSMYGARRQTKVRSMFVDKLLKMVEDPSIQHLISWAKEGDMFYVYNCVKLSQYILPKFFKHNNWQSFVRQLNMYGFHKIYRYDREESSMNRKNPETQRWQFYHPHFQREYPHLRKNIKRKSTRTMSAVPTASRVVFEHGKGYFLQREDRSRSNSGEENGTDQPGDKTSPLTDEDNSSMTAPGAPTPRHYSHYATLGSVTNAKSVKAEGMRKERKITETPAITREEGPVYPHHNPAYVKGVHELPQQPYDASGCRPPSFSDRTQGQYPTRYPIDTKSHDRSSAMSINDAFAPAAGSMPPGPPDQHQGTRPRAGTESYLRRQFGQRSDQRHGNMQSQMSLLDSPVAHPDFPMSPSSRDMAPQTSPRSMVNRHRSFGSIGDASLKSNSPKRLSIESSVVKGVNGLSSPQGTSAHMQYRAQEQPGHPHPPHHHQHLRHGSIPSHPQPLDDHRQGRSLGPSPFPKEYPSSQFSLPPPPPILSGNNITPNLQPSTSSPLSAPSTSYVRPFPTPLNSQHTNSTQGMAPHSRADVSSPDQHTVKLLESRLAFVEDSFASMKQFTQRLESIQASQDRTITWMRERLEQLTDGAQFQDKASSPPTPQSAGPMSTKRKADYVLDDARGRPRIETPHHGPSRGGGPSHTSPGRHDNNTMDSSHHPSFGSSGPSQMTGGPGSAAIQRYSNSPQNQLSTPATQNKPFYPSPSLHPSQPSHNISSAYSHTHAPGLSPHQGYPAHATTASSPHAHPHLRHQRLHSSS